MTLPQKNLTKAEKREYLLQKYEKRDKLDIDDIKKYGVFWLKKDTVDKWKLICVCDSREECLEQISWRYNYHKTKDGDIVIDNDKRFETFRDETLNKDEFGNTIEPDDSDMVNIDDIPQNASFMEALNTTKTGKFKSMNFYTSIDLDYAGFYKVEEYYDVS